MQANDYQNFTAKTAIYPKEKSLEYLTLGLNGESGEIADKVKKFIRDSGYTTIDDLTPEDKHNLSLELGDVLWYIARLADELGYDLEYIFTMNHNKLQSRKDRGSLGGSGDHR
jgi:NTP pyrophosphatase (non-canonical NTP hydrolase)